MIKFNTTKAERNIIDQIVKRAMKMAAEDKIKWDAEQCAMDIKACHCNGRPLALEKLLKCEDHVFGHDVYGIRKFMDRNTGKLKGFFDPRCSLPEPEVKKRKVRK